jgi:heptaprenyl diphosphate synthase
MTSTAQRAPIVRVVDALEILAMPAVADDMARFEPLLAESVEIGDEFLDDITTHLIKAGGKRLRPVLAIASATGGTRAASPQDLLGGVSLELMHLASLYHDDVMDEADVRRSVESVNSRYSNIVAIVAGDFLMARSAAIAASLGVEVARLLADTLALLTRGQVSEVRTAYSVERTIDEYYEAIGGKTASLMASACQVGALTAGLGDDAQIALGAFGTELGLVFQLRDDILDITAVGGELGKPAGQDLAEGIYTLPVLYALEDATVSAELGAILGGPLGEPEREKARSLVAASNGVARSLDQARRHAAQAGDLAGSLESPVLAAGFAALAQELLVDLPS